MSCKHEIIETAWFWNEETKEHERDYDYCVECGKRFVTQH
jgi:hypothetical protein